MRTPLPGPEAIHPAGASTAAPRPEPALSTESTACEAGRIEAPGDARRPGSSSLRRPQGDPRLEAAAALGAVGGRDPSAVALHDPGRDRQAQAGAPGRRVVGTPEALEDVRQVLRPGSRARRPRPGAATAARRRAGRAPPREPPAGVWATALSTRIVTSCRSRRASPSTSAGQGVDDQRRRRARPPSPCSGPTASTATSARSTGARSSSIVPASVRARSSRSSTSAVRWAVSASMSSSAAPTCADRLVLVAPQVRHAGPDHRQRRPQLVARVGRELALAAQGGLAPVDRGPDRHQGPAGVDPAGGHGQGEGGQAADDEDPEERARGAAARRSARRSPGRRTCRRRDRPPASRRGSASRRSRPRGRPRRSAGRPPPTPRSGAPRRRRDGPRTVPSGGSRG